MNIKKTNKLQTFVKNKCYAILINLLETASLFAEFFLSKTYALIIFKICMLKNRIKICSFQIWKCLYRIDESCGTKIGKYVIYTS